MGFFDRWRLAKEWDEEKHPRGKTTPESNAGSFAPSTNGDTLSSEDQGGDTVAGKKLPKGYSVSVQHHTEGPGYVGLIHYYTDGMRYATQVGRSYGKTKKEALQGAHDQVFSGKFNVL